MFEYPELKSGFLYTRDLFFFQMRSYIRIPQYRGEEKKAARSYRTVPHLIAACGKTQFSSRARRTRADPIWSRRPRRRRTVEESRAFTGKRSVSSILWTLPFTPRGVLAYSMEIRGCAQRSAHIFNSFPLSPGIDRPARGWPGRNAGGIPPRGTRKSAPRAIAALPHSLAVFFSPAARSRWTFLLIKNFTEPRLSQRVFAERSCAINKRRVEINHVRHYAGSTRCNLPRRTLKSISSQPRFIRARLSIFNADYLSHRFAF